MHDIISIIVPVYNVEKYLEQCVDSIINQTYKNLEIILVNDGSTDNSGVICDKYKQIDHRIKVMHKENGGQSSARNIGLDIANGKYVGFVDSDDWIESDMYESLYKRLSFYNADIVTCGCILEYFNFKNVDVRDREENTVEIFDSNKKEQLCKNFFCHKLYSSGPCDKLYRITLFDNIRFPENKFYEDNYIALEILLKAKVIIASNDKYYHYRQNSSSTTRGYSYKKYQDAISAEMHNIEIIKKHYPYLVKFAFAPLYLRYFQFFDLLVFNIKNNKDEKVMLDIRGKIRKNISNIVRLNNISLKEKIAFVTIATNVNLYKWLRSLQKKNRGNCY